MLLQVSVIWLPSSNTFFKSETPFDKYKKYSVMYDNTHGEKIQ
ncbi:unnamed protein product [Brassica oleracea]